MPWDLGFYDEDRNGLRFIGHGGDLLESGHRRKRPRHQCRERRYRLDPGPAHRLHDVQPAEFLPRPQPLYAVVGYNALSNKPFEVFNPWGGTTANQWCPQAPSVDGLFWQTGNFLSANFNTPGMDLGTGKQPE